MNSSLTTRLLSAAEEDLIGEFADGVECSPIEAAELVADLIRADVEGKQKYLGRKLFVRIDCGVEKAPAVMRKWQQTRQFSGGGGWSRFGSQI